MRWAIPIGVLGVVVLVAVLSQGRGGGDRTEFVSHISKELEARGAPPPLTDCVVRRLDTALNNKEIEKIYESERGVERGAAAVLASPRVKLSVEKTMIMCGLGLVRSGRLSKAELVRALHRMERGGVSSQGRTAATAH